jgi:simple sugar transport system ATP-binding protein
MEVKSLAPMLQMKGITKRFPAVLANDHVDISVEKGEILALVGENGAGKSTLMNILYGLYQADEGEILFNGQPIRMADPMEAIKHGIGMVHQHFMLVNSFTVYENIILAAEPKKGTSIDRNTAIAQVQELAKKNGFQIDPKARIRNLSVGTQQRVEILKTLYRGAELLILDEPTAVLTPQETVELFEILKTLKKQGKSIIFITHKLEEVMAISDQVTVMRLGKVTMTKATKDTNIAEIARSMVGREVFLNIKRGPYKPGADILEVKNLWAGDDRGLLALKGLDFAVRSGEIVGIAGVAGNGQTELVEVLAGLRPSLAGEVVVEGKNVTNGTPLQVREAGVAHIPEDRYKRGLAGGATVEENTIMFKHNTAPIRKGMLIDDDARRNYAEDLIAKFDVRPANRKVKAGSLSGGNAQKVIVGRELGLETPFMIAAQPTRGLDIGAIEFIHTKLMDMRDRGGAVLLVSTELDEVMSLSDRILVMYEGQIMGEVDRNATEEEIGLLMAGIRPTEKAEGRA